MLCRNATKEVIQPFSIGNDDRVTGTYLAIVDGRQVRMERKAMVEVFTPSLKPGEVVDIPGGLFVKRYGAGAANRGSYMDEISMTGKIVPVEAGKAA